MEEENSSYGDVSPSYADGSSNDDLGIVEEESSSYGDVSPSYADGSSSDDSGIVEASFHIPFIDCDEVCHVDYPGSGDPAGWCGGKCTYSKGHKGLHLCSNGHMWPTGYNPDRWDNPDSPFHPTPL